MGDFIPTNLRREADTQLKMESFILVTRGLHFPGGICNSGSSRGKLWNVWTRFWICNDGLLTPSASFCHWPRSPLSVQTLQTLGKEKQIGLKCDNLRRLLAKLINPLEIIESLTITSAFGYHTVCLCVPFAWYQHSFNIYLFLLFKNSAHIQLWKNVWDTLHTMKHTAFNVHIKGAIIKLSKGISRAIRVIEIILRGNL